MEMETIQEKEKDLIADFEMFEDWMEKYEYIIDLGKELKSMPEEMKIEENLIKGCQSQVWLFPEQKEGRLYFEADSDALITKGLVAIVVRVFSGSKAEEIVRSDLSFISAIGLDQHLSPTRSNGFMSMIKQIKNYAFALQST